MINFTRSLGIALIVWGAVTIIFHAAGIVSRRTEWIYNWGETNAWIIKISFVAAGIVLFLLTQKLSKKVQKN